MSKSAADVPVIGVTMGDPSGVGPEVIAKALRNRIKDCSFILIGDRRVYQRFFKHFSSDVTVCDIPLQAHCPMGRPSRTAGQASVRYLEKAVEFLKNDIIDSLVTGPVCKESVALFHKNFRGHTEYLARAFGVKRFDMMFVSPRVRISLVTRHVPLKNVPALITRKAVLDSIALMDETLKRHFRIRSPRIAVLGLNPHAGEGGLLGHEDVRAIFPAIQSARRQGIKADGPFPADTFFVDMGTASKSAKKAKLSPHGSFDGIVAMYHDQGLIPVKGMYFKELVNFTTGLPFVRTSPVHGTAFDIAGRGIANPSSMIAAIKLACELTEGASSRVTLSKAAGGGRVEGSA